MNSKNYATGEGCSKADMVIENNRLNKEIDHHLFPKSGTRTIPQHIAAVEAAIDQCNQRWIDAIGPSRFGVDTERNALIKVLAMLKGERSDCI